MAHRVLKQALRSSLSRLPSVSVPLALIRQHVYMSFGAVPVDDGAGQWAIGGVGRGAGHGGAHETPDQHYHGLRGAVRPAAGVPCQAAAMSHDCLTWLAEGGREGGNRLPQGTALPWWTQVCS